MKKTLKRIGAMCLVFAASMSMQAQTVTATWDFANNCAGLGAKGQDGSTMTATTIASDVDGIAITVEYNGGSIKNNDNSYQVSNGVVFKIPVISARDEITVEGYNGYSHYVFGDGEEMTNTNTHKVTVAEAAQGYVALKSVNNNNYYNKITVVQKGAIMEQRLYSTDFTNWKALSASTSETTVSVKTKYTAETLDFKLFDTEVKPDGTNAKFEGQGWLMAAKSDDPYIITSALKHISKVHYVHAATGGSRGWKLECKGDGDADWVVLSSSFCEQAGSPVDVTVNRTNCQLRWTNLNGSQNAYMLELAIYGNVDMSKEPMLGSFVANGTTYQAVEIFDMDENGDYVADIEVSKKATMISASNPLTEVTAENGTLGTISYEAQSDNSCIATIPVSLDGKTVKYKAHFIWKPDFTLTYYNTDGKELGTQLVEKDATIEAFKYSESDVTVPAGKKFRGWFQKSFGDAKYTTDFVVVEDRNVYALATTEETTSTSVYYDLSKTTFYAEDHDGFTPSADAHYHNNHGWIFGGSSTLELLVSEKADILMSLCQYSAEGDLVFTFPNGTTQNIAAKVTTDGKMGGVHYEGTAGTVKVTFPGTTYMHKIIVNQDANPMFVQDGENSITAKQVSGDAFFAVLDVANNAEGTERITINLPAGTFDLNETVLTQIKRNYITIAGAGMMETTIKNAPPIEQESIDKTGTLQNVSDYLELKDLTLQNALDYYSAGSAGRAICLHEKGNHTICRNVRMLSYQDTYYSNANGNYYFENCEIHGTVDYICGAGNVMFYKTLLVNESRSKSGNSGDDTITAYNGTGNFGYVFQDCTIETLSSTFNFSRTWNNKPRVYFLWTTINQPEKIISTRWTVVGMNKVLPEEFGEFASYDKAGNIISPASNIVEFKDDKNNPKETKKMETILKGEKAMSLTLPTMFADDPDFLDAIGYDPTSIRHIDGKNSGKVATTQYYNALGARVSENAKGVILKVETTTDGQKTVKKVIR